MNYFPSKGYSNICSRMHAFVEFYISKHSHNTLIKGSYRAQSAVEILSSMSDNKTYVRDQLLQTLTAAQDTTMTLTCNAIELLARHSRCGKS